MSAPNRVPGHTLILEGQTFDTNGKRLFGHTEGCAKCSCGALSPRLTSKNACKRWHRDHKASEWSSPVGQSPGRRPMAETRIPEALALLRERGWCKGHLYFNGAHCIHGALLEAYRVTPCLYKEAPAYAEDDGAVRRVVLSHYGEKSLAAFNDDAETTFEMVEAILEKAILERGGSL